MLDFLRTLWKSRLRVLTENLVAEEQEYREIANLAAHIGADYHGRFLIELLQNAGDQAIEAGMSDSTVTIVRTAEFVAVANQGVPFNDDGIRAITSLGVSPKDPRFAIGNKGVGFKAVFQVTTSPEIYTASSATKTFLDDDAIRFRLDQSPLDNLNLACELRVLAQEIFDRRPELAAELEKITGAVDLVSTVLAAARAAAPFKFPLPLEADNLEARLRLLSLPPDCKTTSQTLIALPLILDEKTKRVVDTAVDELLSRSGATILFLSGVGRIELVDQVRDIHHEIVRSQIRSTERLARGVYYKIIKTSVTSLAKNQIESQETNWWYVSRTLGSDEGVDPAIAEAERGAIRKAASVLPGKGWDKVDTATVSVALPMPDSAKPPGTPLGANGLICIGLPTHDHTGTPAWVDARFHGTISRTGIDLRDSQYNRLLFQEAVRLMEDLVERLKSDLDVDTKRAVTLAMETSNGPLAGAIRERDGLVHGEIVLDASGQGFIPAASLALPASEDIGMFGELTVTIEDVSAYGFKLADGHLLRNARDLLIVLSGKQGQAQDHDPRFLARLDGQLSLLEVGASVHRGDGHDFWHRFLEWVLKRFPAADLQDQCILPVGEDKLAAPASQVFWKPVPPGGASNADDDEEELGTIHDSVSRVLRFLDENAVQVREDQGRILTPLARKLAPDSGPGLVKRPRREDLLNDALAPRLREIAADPAKVQLALSLLEQTLEWLHRMNPAAKRRVRFDGLLVPTKGSTGSWTWVSPTEVYLGRGWQNNRTDELLTLAYGRKPDRQLVPWDEFVVEGGIEQARREWWVDGMVQIGVSKCPKVLVAPRPRKAPLASKRYDRLSRNREVDCPLSGVSKYWIHYLDDIKERKAETKTGQAFDVQELTWIDGLEQEEVRAAIVELVLTHPTEYEQYIETYLERADGNGDRTKVPSLWVHAIHTGRWQVVPTEAGLREPAEIWWLEADQRRLQQDRYSHLCCVPIKFAGAERVLYAIGVATLERASIERLVDALQDLAHSLSSLEPEQKRSAMALATELYTRLQRRCGDQDASVKIKKILDRPVPLQRGQHLVSVELGSVGVVYVDDDPVRAQFIPNVDAAYKLPLQARTTHAALLTALRNLIGVDQVLRTSEAPVATGFMWTLGKLSPRFLDYLSEKFPGASVAVDLGLLLAFGGHTLTSSTGNEFKKTWDRISKTKIQFGEFPPGSGFRSFFDEHTPDGPVLQVSESLEPFKIVEASWAIVGPGYRDLWAAYARALQQRQVQQFLAERQIGATERDEIEAAIGLAPAERLLPLQPALLVIWRRMHPMAAIEEFYREWKAYTRRPEDVCAWLGVPNLDTALIKARDQTEEEATLFVLCTANVSIVKWQSAREELGFPRWRFAASARLYSEARDSLAAGLMAVAAHSPSVDLDVAQGVISALRTTNPDTAIIEQPPSPAAIVAAILRHATDLVENVQDHPAVELLAIRLEALKADLPGAIKCIVPEDAARREVELYLHEPEERRTFWAQEVTKGLLKVAVELAKVLGEGLDADEITGHPRVAAFSSGWWANRFAVLAAIQQAIARVAPQTAKELSEKRAFRDPLPWQELRARFSALQKLSSSNAAQRPKRQVSLLGITSTQDELLQDLALGSTGNLGKRLSDAAVPALDLAALCDAHRQVAAVPAKGRRGTWGGGSGTFQANESNYDREVNGLLGEAFVYEQFRRILRDFDEASWMSTNRSRYGLNNTGSDGHGCDFIYRDVDGTLTGRTDQPECYIEVKATSEDGTDPFPMSMSEWEKALSCHESGGSQVYIIVRVQHVQTAPAISDILVDPVSLWTRQHIAFAAKDLWIYVGKFSEGVSHG